MNKKRTSRDFIVRAAMTLLVMLFTSATAWAEKETVSYIDENGKEKEVEATILTRETDISSKLSGGWYIVKNTNSSGVDVSYSSQVNFDGDTSLILADGASITLVGDNGIVVEGSLNIYGQSEGTGSLSSKATGDYGDGIYAIGNISIIGGIITTTSDYNCGINNNGGNITICGGTVNASATGEDKFGIYANGNIILGYTKDTDHIFASSYGVASGKSISIYSGKTMIDGQNTYSSSGTISSSDIKNKILAPNLFGIGPNNDGSSSSKPYIINSPVGLQLLATYVNSGTISAQLSEDPNTFYVYEDKHFKLTENIKFISTNDENNFTPIGGKFGDYYAFSGSFDGDGQTISGIHIDYIDYDDLNNSDSYAGIFGLLGKGAEIKNITLDNADISGKDFIGGIVGKNEDGSISNCLVTNSSIYGISSNHKGVIAGLNTSEGILDHNYYSDCKLIKDDENYYTTEIGCGTGTDTGNGHQDVTQMTVKGVTYKDGATYYVSAVDATILSETEPVPNTLSGKTFFYREFTGGSPSTICLPFAFTPNESNGKFYTFTGVDESKWEATMTEAEKEDGKLAANKPYIFVPDENRSIVPILFHGDAAYASNPSTTSGNWSFRGTYAEVKWDNNINRPEGIYGFSAQTVEGQSISQGQFVKVGEYVKIRSLRAYLEYSGSSFPNTRGTLSEEELPDRILVRLVDSDGDITGIGELDMKTGEVTFDNGWYTLEGVRLSGKPAKHGIYVNNGRKHMIK